MKLSTIKKVLNAELIGQDVSFDKVSIDTRTLEAGSLYVAIKGEQFDGHQFVKQAFDLGACAALVSDTASVPQTGSALVVEDTIQALGQLAQYHRQQFDIPCIGITGSCGKTTTRGMVNHILSFVDKTHTPQRNFNNHIGLPLTLLELNNSHKFLVLEMGASAQFEIAYLSTLAKQNIALITNVQPAHLEGFGSIEGVAKAKSEIYEGLENDGIAILNLETPYVEQFKQVIGQRKTITYGHRDDAMIYAKNIKNSLSGSSFTLCTPKGDVAIQLNVPGEHNVTNALAATACVYPLEVSLKTIQEALQSFDGVQGRMRRIHINDKLTVIDDTYNANPGSFEVAIDYLKQADNQKIIVMGDMKELGENCEQMHKVLGETAKAKGIDKLYATGPLSQLTVKAFGDNGFWFEDKASLTKALKNNQDDSTILVKGSRSTKMEQVIQGLQS